VVRHVSFSLRRSLLALAATVIVGAALVQAAAADNLIVPGKRVGPVALGEKVKDIVKELGRPDRRWRDTTRVATPVGTGQATTYVVNSDFVSYGYTAHCLRFTWEDKGLYPTVESGIRITCGRWRTETGVGVGSSIEQVLAAMGKPHDVANCKTDRPECIIKYNTGLWFRTRNRHSPVYEVYVVARTP
jgi:hypothetical protein